MGTQTFCFGSEVWGSQTSLLGGVHGDTPEDGEMQTQAGLARVLGAESRAGGRQHRHPKSVGLGGDEDPPLRAASACDGTSSKRAAALSPSADVSPAPLPAQEPWQRHYTAPIIACPCSGFPASKLGALAEPLTAEQSAL